MARQPVIVAACDNDFWSTDIGGGGQPYLSPPNISIHKMTRKIILHLFLHEFYISRGPHLPQRLCCLQWHRNNSVVAVTSKPNNKIKPWPTFFAHAPPRWLHRVSQGGRSILTATAKKKIQMHLFVLALSVVTNFTNTARTKSSLSMCIDCCLIRIAWGVDYCLYV